MTHGAAAPKAALLLEHRDGPMIEISVAALARAWITTVIATGLLFAALATAQVWNSAVYLHSLPQALRLVGDGPPPVIDRWY